MPSGRGHFSGGSHSHSGGHFSIGRSHSSSHSAGHFGGSGGFRPTLRWRPHTTVIFGRPVYLGAGRACTVSVLGILITFAVIASALLGLGWFATANNLTTICANYEHYRNVALTAEEDSAYRIFAQVDFIEQYGDTGKYCICYTFGSYYEGYSFYVYTYEEASKLKKEGVWLALSDRNDEIDSMTDSIPLDYWKTSLEDDAEYLDYLGTRNGLRVATFVALGLTVVMVVSAVVVPLTAQKATKEQLAENNQTNASGNSANQNSSSAGTWRCDYCNTLNDSSKDRCDGCGAKRQK